jgi:catechol 2,3-dioxygenase-like lactoylglutathione lyase family enzyme
LRQQNPSLVAKELAAMPTSLAHVSLGTNQLERAKAFYDVVLGAIGIVCLFSFDSGAGYGRGVPEFWVTLPHDQQRASAGNGVHVCFLAQSVEQVQAFHAKALEMGGRDDGAPGYRREYRDNYYAAFVRDLDGNKIEAVVFT